MTEEERPRPPDARPHAPRPPLLGRVTLFLASLATLGLGIWRPGRDLSLLWFALVSTGMIYGVLYALWRGHNWARIAVLLTSIVVAIPAAGMFGLYGGALGLEIHPLERAVMILEGVLALWLLWWLNSKPVRRYFWYWFGPRRRKRPVAEPSDVQQGSA